MIGGKFYGWTPPKKTTTTSTPTFADIVADAVKNYKPKKPSSTPVYGVDERRALNNQPPKKETKHPLTGASGNANTQTQSAKHPLTGASGNANTQTTSTPSIWDQFTNLPDAAKEVAQSSFNSAAARGAAIAAAAGTAGTQGEKRPVPIVDVDVRRGQLGADYGTPGMPALDNITTPTFGPESWNPDAPYVNAEDPNGDGDNSDGSGGGDGGGGGGDNGPGTTPVVGDGSEEVFQGPTEAELALERAKRLWSNRLKTAAAAAESARKRLMLESDAANEQNLRDTYGQFRDHRRSLSGSGTGFSPRFTLAVKQALDQQSRARAADIRRSHVNQMRDIIGNLRDVRDTASENLSDEELNLLLTSSGDNLANVTGENIASWFNTKKSGESS